MLRSHSFFYFFYCDCEKTISLFLKFRQYVLAHDYLNSPLLVKSIFSYMVNGPNHTAVINIYRGSLGFFLLGLKTLLKPDRTAASLCLVLRHEPAFRRSRAKMADGVPSPLSQGVLLLGSPRRAQVQFHCIICMSGASHRGCRMTSGPADPQSCCHPSSPRSPSWMVWSPSNRGQGSPLMDQRLLGNQSIRLGPT